MKINEAREITSIEVTKEKKLFAINLLDVARNWAEIAYHIPEQEDIGNILIDIIEYFINHENDNVIPRRKIV